jgi:polysaccharide biosynthesis transport protein
VTDSNNRQGVAPIVPISQKWPSSFSSEPAIGLTLLSYWEAVRRHVWKIAIFVAVTLLCTAIILLRLPKRYEGTAVIRLDPSSMTDVAGGQGGNTSQANMAASLATDQKEILTPAVVTPTILKVGLWHAPADGSSTTVPTSIVAKTIAGITVNQVKGTYLLNVSYRCTSASQAAAMANGLAEQFIEHEYETRNSALVSLSQYMREQIQELGGRMKDSQMALNAFERENNIVNPDNISSLLTQQLSSLQQELGQEQSQQRSLEANLALAKEGSLDAILVSDRGSALAPLLQAQQQAEMEFASLSSKYGPGNYLYQQERRKLDQINKAVQIEQKHISAQIEAQARAEEVKVGLTAKELADVKTQLDDFNRKNVQFTILKHKSDTDKTIYDDLLERLDAADVAAGYHSTALRIIDPALPNPVPVYPRVNVTLLFALLISGMLGVMGAVAASGMDRTLRDPRGVHSALGVELLGSLPEVRDEAELRSLMPTASADQDLEADRSPFVESLCGIRSTLLLGATDVPLRALAVISSRPGEGKTTIAVNLAASLASLGKRTVLVDGDLRRPQLHRILNISNRLGLSSVLQGQASLSEALIPGRSERLKVLPAGPPSAGAREQIASRIGVVIEELKSRFDIVVIDTPPMLGFADGVSVATVADASLLVVRAGQTPREYVQSVIDQLRQVRAPLAGVVLNGITPEMNRHYYYYHDGYYSYSSRKNGDHDV